MTVRRWRIGLGIGVLAASIPTVSQADFPLLGRKKDKDANVVQAGGTTSSAADTYWEKAAAKVNGEVISYDQLARELIETHGRDQIQLMINRKLVEQACKENKIEVTGELIDAEVNKTLKNLNLNRKEFSDRVLASRGITYPQYIRDTVWPAIALKELVKDKVEVTDDDLKKSYEANYGERVDVRMLVVREVKRAQDLWEAIEHPDPENPEKKLSEKEKLDRFEEFCKTYSVDQATRPYGGKTQPICRHSAYPEIEDLAFGLKEGELSKIIQVPEGNLMLFCVKRIAARDQVKMDTVVNETTGESVQDILKKDLYEKKLRYEVSEYFKGVRQTAQIDDFTSPNFDVDSLKETIQERTVSHTEPAGSRPKSGGTAPVKSMPNLRTPPSGK